jgi:hypothetical protein
MCIAQGPYPGLGGKAVNSRLRKRGPATSGFETSTQALDQKHFVTHPQPAMPLSSRPSSSATQHKLQHDTHDEYVRMRCSVDVRLSRGDAPVQRGVVILRSWGGACWGVGGSVRRTIKQDFLRSWWQ